MKQKVECLLETREKKDKSGTYQCLVIQLTPTYEKQVFLEKAELELLKMVDSKSLPFGK